MALAIWMILAISKKKFGNLKKPSTTLFWIRPQRIHLLTKLSISGVAFICKRNLYQINFFTQFFILRHEPFNMQFNEANPTQASHHLGPLCILASPPFKCMVYQRKR
jgi:hypothetical protein